MWTVRFDSNRGKVRAVNQDCLVSETLDYDGSAWLLCGVADGMGGALSGDVASRIAVNELVSGIRRNISFVGPSGALEQAFIDANHKIFSEAQIREECAGMGTTLTTALVGPNCFYLGHVGDSRAYVFGGNKLSRLTKDHSLVEELVRQGGLSPRDAERHPQRHMLTRALGTEEHTQADFSQFQLTQEDLLLFCSDGLTRLISDSELQTLLTVLTDPHRLVGQLIDLALERGAPDNVTVVVVFWEGGGALDGRACAR